MTRAVFINCPYDKEYRPHFWALVFAVMEAGFEPRSALDIDDSEARLSKIIRIMKSCDCSIHDLCRTDAPRFNMPFEAGIAVGLSASQKGGFKQRAMVLTTSMSKLRRTCSDMLGVDAHVYRGWPVHAATIWLQQFFNPRDYVPSPELATRRFKSFWRGLPAFAKKSGWRPDTASWFQMLAAVHSFLRAHPLTKNNRDWD